MSITHANLDGSSEAVPTEVVTHDIVALRSPNRARRSGRSPRHYHEEKLLEYILEEQQFRDAPQTLINAAAKFGKDHPLGTKEAVETNAGGDARLQRRCPIGTSRLSCASKPWSLNMVLSHENGKWSCGFVRACDDDGDVPTGSG